MLRWRLIRLTPIFIVLFWLIMMGLLTHRLQPIGCARSSSINPDSKEIRLFSFTDNWYGIYLSNEEQIGFLNFGTIPGTRDGEEGIQLHLSCRAEIQLLEIPTSLSVFGSAWISKNEGLKNAILRVRTEDTEWRLEATTTKDNLLLQIYTGGEVIPFQVPLKNVATLWEPQNLLGPEIPELEPGGETTIEAFDPINMKAANARVACLYEEVISIQGKSISTRVYKIMLNSMSTRIWVAHEKNSALPAQILQVELPIGLLLKKIDPEDAFNTTDNQTSSNFFQINAIQPSGMRPYEGAKRMVVKLDGLSENTPIPVDDIQQALDTTTFVIISPPQPPNSLELRSEKRLFADALEPDTLIQSEHPTIVETAKQIIGEEKNQWSCVTKLNQWVWENLTKKPVPGIPSALEILKKRIGDCNEHTILFVALARAIGIPSRVCLGVVWSPQFEAFYYHAWPEVYIETSDTQGHWYWIDPTLGQQIADATHIKLVSGGIHQWFQLLRYLGNLRIEVIQIE